MLRDRFALLVDWWLVGWLAGWLAGGLAGWLAGLLVGWRRGELEVDLTMIGYYLYLSLCLVLHGGRSACTAIGLVFTLFALADGRAGDLPARRYA